MALSAFHSCITEHYGYTTGTLGCTKGLSTPKGRREHATPHMPVETERSGGYWLLKIGPKSLYNSPKTLRTPTV